MDFVHIVALYLWILSLVSPSQYAEAAVDETCIRAINFDCKFYCGQDILDLSAIDGSSTQPSRIRIRDGKLVSDGPSDSYRTSFKLVRYEFGDRQVSCPNLHVQTDGKVRRESLQDKKLFNWYSDNFPNIPDSQESSVFYQWSPCTKFMKNCSDFVNVCRVFETTKQSYNLGDKGPAIIFDKKRKRYRMGYVGPEEHLIGERKTDVYLEYDANSEGRTSPMKNYGDYFTMTLYTKYVPHSSLKNSRSDDGGSLSAGSVILIVMLCIAVLYLGIGMPYMKFQRGAKGKEMIPHYPFWSDIPALVKDGCSYTLQTVQCCASSAGAEVSTRRDYERI